MGRGILLWLLGVPIPVILLLWLSSATNRYVRRSSKDQAPPLLGEPDFFDHETRAFLLIFRYELGQGRASGKQARTRTTAHYLGPGQFGQRAKSALVPVELDLSYRRIDAGMAFGRNNEPEYVAINPNGRVPTLVDGDYVLWESNSVMHYLCVAYGKGSPIYPSAPKARARSTAGWTGRCRRCSQSIARCSGRWCARHQKSATWSRSRRMPTPKPCNGGSSIGKSRRGASSKAISSPSPISRLAPMRGAGSASKASPSRNCQISSAGSPSFPRGQDLCNSSRHRCRERSENAVMAGAKALSASSSQVPSIRVKGMRWLGQSRIITLSARSARDAAANADSAADLDAGVRALDPHKSRAIRRA